MQYFEDYDNELSFEKFTHRKKKNRGKGHQSRHGSKYDTYDIYYREDEDTIDSYSTPLTSPAPTPKERPNPNHFRTTTSAVTPTTPREFGPNTREIKTVKIDYDGVIDITKVDNQKNGVQTYGIKFFFSGKKGLFRIIWFNTNARLRDSVYNTEYAFWLSLKNKEV